MKNSKRSGFLECFFCNADIEIDPDKPATDQVMRASWGSIEIKTSGGEAGGGFVCPSCLALLTEHPDLHAHKLSYKCKRCEAVWFPRHRVRPLTCPKCRSPYWDRERL